MQKIKIIDQLKANVDKELTSLKEVYENQQNLIKGGDLKSDGKYDTRGTEAKYLADGQRQRLADLEQELELLSYIPQKKFTKKDKVGIGALVDIKHNDIIRKYFVSPSSGGTMLKIGEEVVLVISVFSPIGEAILGLAEADEFEVELKGSLKEYAILKVR